MKIRLLAVLLALPACTRDAPHADQPAPSAPPAAVAPPQMAPMAKTAPTDDNTLAGTVLETMDSGGYTYAKLDSGGKQVWVAGPETKLAVGTVVGNVTGTLMSGFKSTTLNRTFDEIYFINSFPVTGSAPTNPHGGTPAAPTNALIEKVERAKDGKTIS